MSSSDTRQEFLIAMYNQLMNDINRHIVVVWQSIATLGAAVAVFGLVKDNLFPFDVAVSILLIVCIWLLAHVYDASYWYNRNLVIIANIERQFLNVQDLKEIHYYFGAHRPKNRMISHLSIQKYLGLSVGGLAFFIHANKVLLPVIRDQQEFQILNVAPAIIALGGLYIWRRIKMQNERKYAEFLRNSPGLKIDNKGIEFGKGHGFKKGDDRPNN